MGAVPLTINKKFCDSVYLTGHGVQADAQPPTPSLGNPGSTGQEPRWATHARKGRPSRLSLKRGAREEGREKRGRKGRRKPTREVPTLPGEPARITRGSVRGPEGRVWEEGRPEPQSGNTNAASGPRPA